MVQSLREIMELCEYDETCLKKALSEFKVVNSESEAAQDVMHFLKEDAITMEEEGTTRTYLFLNDEMWNKNEIQIDGYFSIALKVLYFAKNIDETILKNIFNGSTRQNCPAYLIGQIGRSEKTPRGKGAELLATALEYISSAIDIVGGRLIYLDCAPKKVNYYTDHGFKFLQKKHKSDLIQMYRVI